MIPNEVTFEGDDPFLDDFVWHISKPLSPYAVQRAEKQMSLGYGCIFWHPATSGQHTMLEEWWLQNETDLTPDVRWGSAERRLRR